MFRTQLGFSFLLCAILFVTTVPKPRLSGQEKSAKSGQETEQKKQDEKKGVPEGRTEYKGRRIARTMHYTGAEWLIRDVREREERCSLLLANLGLKKGMSICDMGCGNGYHSLQMAKLIGDKGMVYGVDIQSKMLEYLRERCEDQGVENVVPILGSFHNPRIPRDTFDLILMVDVYHEFSHPEYMLKSMRDSLKKNGVIALVEYRMEDEDVPIRLLHKMSKEQIMKEFPANGFKLVKEYNKLPWQHLMFFARDDSDLKEIKASEWKPKSSDDSKTNDKR